MSSNFVPIENRAGIQPIATTNAALPSQYQTGQSQLFGQAHPLGTIIRADDTGTTAFGEGEFIYLIGAANTVVGSLVQYDPVNATTTLVTTGTKQGNPAAVAMSANVANQYGWYQIAGVAVIKKAAVKVNPAVLVYAVSTGRVTSASTAGEVLMNAKSVNAATVASATSTVNVLINRPFLDPFVSP